MSTTVERVCQIMEEWAPKRLAADWDSVGLQLGDPAREVSRVCVALEVTPRVAREAVERRAQMIICHHPFIFRAIKSLRMDNPLCETIQTLIKNDISVYVAHTNLDVAPGGVDDTLAGLLGLQEQRILSAVGSTRYFKIVVFVPVGYEDGVRDAMAAAGAGHIGKYSHCTFQALGNGTFKPLEGANPFIGEQGRLAKVNEYRLETIVPEERCKRVIAAMIKAHPYEEVAYDVYPLANEGQPYGYGRIGRLPAPLTLGEFAQSVAKVLNAPLVRVVGDAGKQVVKVASSCGSGGEQVGKAVFAGADVLVTGDIKYHEAREAEAAGLCLIDAGHYYTEVPVLARIKEYLEDKAKELSLDLEVDLIEGPADPFWTEEQGVKYVVQNGSSSGISASKTRASDDIVGASGTGGLAELEGPHDEASDPGSRGPRRLVLHIDGASRGNPGMAACAVIVDDGEGHTLKEAAFFLGTATNNVAEYNGLLKGLEIASGMGASEVTVLSDSELLVRQVNGDYEVRDPKLAELHKKVLREMARFDKVELVHVRRGDNKAADSLANQAIDVKSDIWK